MTDLDMHHFVALNLIEYCLQGSPFCIFVLFSAFSDLETVKVRLSFGSGIFQIKSYSEMFSTRPRSVKGVISGCQKEYYSFRSL